MFLRDGKYFFARDLLGDLDGELEADGFGEIALVFTRRAKFYRMKHRRLIYGCLRNLM